MTISKTVLVARRSVCTNLISETRGVEVLSHWVQLVTFHGFLSCAGAG